jgi:hypothetical protein
MKKSNTQRGYFLSRNDWFFLALAVVVIITRLVYSVPIEIDGDSVGRWLAAQSIAENVGWQGINLSHQTLRWSILLPQALVSYLLPNRYESYYLLPILLYSVFTILSMVIVTNGREPNSYLLAVLLGVLLTIDPISHVMASQLKTVVFGLIFFVFAVFATAQYLQTRSMIFVVVGALSIFAAYGAHITYIVFGVGPFLALIIISKDYKASLVFVASLLLFLLGELVITTLLLDETGSGGRLGHIVSGVSHSPVSKPRGSGDYLQYVDLFSRWRLVPKFNLIIVVAYLVAATMLFDKRIRKDVPNVIWMFFFTSGLYCLAVSAPIVNLEPLKLALALRTRYLAPVFPLMSVFVVWMLGRVGQVFPKWSTGALIALIGLNAAAFLYGSSVYSCDREISRVAYHDLVEETYCRTFRYSQNQNIYPAQNLFIFKAQSYYQQFNKDYHAGMVSLFPGTRISVLSDLIKFDRESSSFQETPNGWFSVNGEDKRWCVMELGQVDHVRDNYRECVGREANRQVFD